MPIKTPPYYPLAKLFDLYRGEGVHTETVLVTPELARDALARNITNRPINERHVQELLWEIDEGNWKLTHQGWGFNVRENMVDGQHRATAIVRSGKNILVRVTFNLELDFWAPIDSSLDVRQPKHILGMNTREQAICRALIALERPNPGRTPVSKIADTQGRHYHGMDWAKDVFPYQRGITAAFIAAHIFAYPAAPHQVAAFAKQFLARTGSSPHDPAIVLRRVLEKRDPEGRTLMLAVLRCLEAHCKGQTMGRVKETDSGLTYFAEKRAAKGL